MIASIKPSSQRKRKDKKRNEKRKEPKEKRKEIKKKRERNVHVVADTGTLNLLTM